MRELPERFKERMKEQLGAEYEAFLACFAEGESQTGLRVNTGKIAPGRFCGIAPFALEPIPWTENGFYTGKAEQVTKHPYYYAGLYYIQEPSAMLPASRLPISEGDRVLDLCAAPGGKATELASRLHGTGLLVANDVSASRAKALVKNLALWGCTNCCITGETPERLLAAFGCFFDKILVDAPCSGEGMFRKDGGLIESWKTRGPGEYAALQKEILDCAVQMLRPGGMVLYSTCTFSPEEDEQVIEWILDCHPELSLEQAEQAEGLSRGNPPCEKAIRVWPHKARGEGHFLALLRKAGAEEKDSADAAFLQMQQRSETRDKQNRRLDEGQMIRNWRPDEEQTSRNRQLDKGQMGWNRQPDKGKTGRSRLSGEEWTGRDNLPDEVQSFMARLPQRLLQNGVYRQIGEQCCLLPAGVTLPAKLRYLRTGLLLGTCKKGRFEPSQALAMALDGDGWPNVLRLTSGDDRVLRYLKGETLELRPGEEIEKGWALICVDGFPLGWGKAAGGTIKNKYYPGWRLQ